MTPLLLKRPLNPAQGADDDEPQVVDVGLGFELSEAVEKEVNVT